MSRRVILLVSLSVAAIFLASFVLLQGRSDFARPLFPKPWNSGSTSTSDSWLKEHLDGILSDQDKPTTSGDSSTSTLVDEHNKPDSPALADPAEGKKEQGDNAVGTKPALGEAELDDPKSGPLDTAIMETAGFHDEVISTWMIEVGGSHDEVIAALIHSFGSNQNVNIELYQPKQRFGIKDIFDQFTLTTPLPAFQDKRKFNITEKKPRILVSTTCELDSMEKDKEFTALMEAEQTYLFCVVHHADRWVKNKSQRIIQPWVEKGLVDFICLSKHTQNFLDKELLKWDLKTDVKPVTRHFVPVFPVDLSGITGLSNKDSELSFALQGNFDASRRDYNKIFDHLGKFLTNSTFAGHEADLANHDSHPEIQLHLLGHGNKPQVPEDLAPHVKFDEGQDYLNFYGIISKTFALLPGFANDEYLDRKASSTVPASLIAGTPLVATQRILDAYSYLPAEAVWLQAPDEEDFDVIGRVLAMTPAERKFKKDAVKEANKKRVEMNKVLVAEWMREGLSKVRQMAEKKDASADPVMEGVGSSEKAETEKKVDRRRGFHVIEGKRDIWGTIRG